MRKFSVQAGVKKEKHKNSKKRKDIRGNAGGLGQHMITENSWEMKVCPLHPSSCPMQPVLQSPTSLSFVITKNRGKPFLLVYIVMLNKTFFCNELDQTVCFLTLIGPWGGDTLPATRIPAIALH